MCITFYRFRVERWVVWVLAWSVVGLLAGALLRVGHGSLRTPSPPLAAITPIQGFPLAINPETIVFGPISAGELLQHPFCVRNTQQTPLTLQRIGTSCPCIRVTSLPVQVGPAESRGLSVTFDPASEADFVGRLRVGITGYLSDGRIAFLAHVDLEVTRQVDARNDPAPAATTSEGSSRIRAWSRKDIQSRDRIRSVDQIAVCSSNNRR
jgi:hypothetical protein